MNFVVLSSSRGTTFQAVIDALGDGSLSATCKGLITDSSDRLCAEKARTAGVDVYITERTRDGDRQMQDEVLDAVLNEIGDIDVIALMGWMWIFSPWFTEKWAGKIVNVHPSLLPKYGGKGMYGDHVHNAVLASGDRESGASFHTVDSGVDTGTLLLQKSCPILPGDTADSLRERTVELEKEWYPKLLQMIHTGEVSI